MPVSYILNKHSQQHKEKSPEQTDDNPPSAIVTVVTAEHIGYGLPPYLSHYYKQIHWHWNDEYQQDGNGYDGEEKMKTMEATDRGVWGQVKVPFFYISI